MLKTITIFTILFISMFLKIEAGVIYQRVDNSNTYELSFEVANNVGVQTVDDWIVKKLSDNSVVFGPADIVTVNMDLLLVYFDGAGNIDYFSGDTERDRFNGNTVALSGTGAILNGNGDRQNIKFDYSTQGLSDIVFEANGFGSSPSAVPEPSTYLMLLLGSLGLTAFYRKRKK